MNLWINNWSHSAYSNVHSTNDHIVQDESADDDSECLKRASSPEDPKLANKYQNLKLPEYTFIHLCNRYNDQIIALPVHINAPQVGLKPQLCCFSWPEDGIAPMLSKYTNWNNHPQTWCSSTVLARGGGEHVSRPRQQGLVEDSS